MKYIIYLILTIGMLSVSALPTDWPKDWKFTKKTHGTSIWKLKSNPEVRGVYFSENALPGTDWSKIKSKSMFKKWEKPKKKILETVGITNWVASDYNWKRVKKDQYLFSVRGSYVGKDKTRMFFREEHLYKGNKTLQLLVTSPESKMIKKSRVITQLFNHAQSEMKVEKKQEKQKPELEKVSYQDKKLIQQHSLIGYFVKHVI